MEQQAAAQLQQQQAETVSSQLPQSVAGGNQPHEVPRKIAVVAPHTVSNTDATSAHMDSSHDTSDKYTGNGGGGPLTPVSGVPSTGPGLIDPGLSLITLDEEPSGIADCSTTTCSTGGLHMADHKSMVAFARKVNRRLRYHSHCIAGSDFNTSLGPSPGTSPSSTSSTSGALSARARFMKRSLSCPDIKKPTADEKEGLAKRMPCV